MNQTMKSVFRSLSFRAFLGGIIALAFALFLAGCNKAPEHKTATHTDEPAGKFVRFYNWNNYMARETVARFEKSCDCRLIEDYFSDHEEMLAKLAAGATGYDIMVPTGNVVETLIKQKTLQKIDKSRLKNLSQLNPQFLNLWFDPENQYSVPYGYSLTIIGYNAEKIAELGLPTDTWALVFDPQYLEKIKGKITVMDSQRELFGAALRYLGYSVNDEDDKHLLEARDVILKAKPYWAAFNASSYIKELASGDIWVAHGYSNDMFQSAQDAVAAKRPFTIKTGLPKEGAVLAIDNMVIHKSAPHPDMAYELIDFLIDKKSTAELSNLTGSGSVNTESLSLIIPEVRNNKAVFPDEQLQKKLEMLKDFSADKRRYLNRLWTEIKAN
ncbi:MAG: spermidine/putrescine ABC transporter substrate-binding protein [Burkholderiales bacterium]|jgi:spermidine/putrescine transport system substrate-binding protein|nr:spermidine/putrescine ABC transporter substrate-binding protein [Burkholderiales bacterium]